MNNSRDQPAAGLRMAPLTVLTIGVVVGLLAVTLVMVLAHRQPWVGVKLVPAAEGGAVVVRSQGPAAGIPAGTRLTGMESAAGKITFEPRDFTIEPDGVIPDYRVYDRFLERQDLISRIQASPQFDFISADGAAHPVRPDLSGRPLWDMPPDFWVTLVVGLLAWLVSSAVFAFRQADAGARYLLLSGAATLAFAPASAIYITRELGMDGTLFRCASDLNFFGGSVFAASFVSLLLHYPRRIAPTWVGITILGVFVAWFIAQQVDVFSSMTFARRFLVMIGVGTTFLLAGVHWVKTRRDPVARAALQWFLLSWMLGTCLFTGFILLPQMFGVDTTSMQGYAFLLFILVYAGLAFGIMRYRLFELGVWWRRVVMWALTVLLLVLLDMLFLFVLGFSGTTSIGITLLVCGVVWLPFRAWIWNRLAERRERQQADHFRQAMDVALTPKEGEADERWQNLLRSAFDPLNLGPDETPAESVEISRDGLCLRMPAVGKLEALRIEYPKGGRRLFAPHDLSFAQGLVEMVSQAIESRSSYEKGVAEERGRIARDMHDNIGAQLLAALHSHDAESKDSKIRETLGDLRSVINNSRRENLTIDEMLAELRVETGERLSGAGIRLRWTGDQENYCSLPPAALQALRPIVREAVSNVIRHSGAAEVLVTMGGDADGFSLMIHDDGKGFSPANASRGRGLSNIRERVERLGGSFTIVPVQVGAYLVVRIPMERTPS